MGLAYIVEAGYRIKTMLISVHTINKVVLIKLVNLEHVELDQLKLIQFLPPPPPPPPMKLDILERLKVD